MFIKNLKRTYNILYKEEKKKLIKLFFLTLLVTFFELISLGSIPVYISLIFEPTLMDKYLLKLNASNLIVIHQGKNFIYYLSFAVIGIFLIKNIFIGFFYYFNSRFIQDLNVRIGKEIYRKNIYSDYLLHINRSPAELIRNHGEIRKFANLIGHYQRLLLEIILLFFILIISIKVFFEITILFFLIFFLFYLFYFIAIKKWLNKAGRKIQTYKKIELSLLENTFSAIKEIKFNLKELFFIKIFNDNYFKINRVIFLQGLINRIPKISLEMLAIVSITLVSIFLYLGEASNAIKISNLSFLSVVALRLIPAFNGISVATTAIKYTEPSIDIIEKDLNNLSNYSNLDYKNEKKYSKEIKTIKLENLAFNYGSKSETLFSNINLEIKKNDKIGVFGKSGSGKTSLVNLLTGLIPPIMGNIFINGVNISDKPNFFYNKISYIAQDTILFNDTIINNITFNAEVVNNEKLEKIIEICKLNKFIKSTPLGLKAEIGEKGLKISGGQKQRIGIARALYKDFDLLILDEATSALHEDYEKDILKSIYDLFEDKIIIIISHNIKNLENCNKVVEIENNKLNIKDRSL